MVDLRKFAMAKFGKILSKPVSMANWPCYQGRFSPLLDGIVLTAIDLSLSKLEIFDGVVTLLSNS
ncbi:MAG: hypothetical protein EAZ81_12405 [Verrucomicrobia bacterium]|nr:MAG: hypothetical protein EAZ81_12405 [Verrucomicrobiota bacterium]